MKNFVAFACALVALVVLALNSPFAALAAPAAHHDMEASGKACANCAATCEKTLAYFESKGGKYAEAKNLDKLKDCIALCKASADLKSRKSAHAQKLDNVCKEVCQACSDMCKELKDPALKDCIESCETCHHCCS